MSTDEVWTFLSAPRTLHVATINPGGTPHLVPMYYAVMDGEVAVWTYGKSQKVRNLERDPRVTLMAEAGDDYAELRGVSITGTARIERDADVVAAVGEALYPRYFGELNDAARAGVAHSARKRVAIFVRPEEVVSWDHRKLGNGGGG